MIFRRFEDAAAFLEATEPLLLTDVAKYGLALGVAQRCRDGEPFGPEPPWFAALEEAGRATVSAVHTPPFALNLTDATESAIEEIIEESFCCLFTDLANPVPNRIYQRIGYRRICDFQHEVFDPDRRDLSLS